MERSYNVYSASIITQDIKNLSVYFVNVRIQLAAYNLRNTSLVHSLYHRTERNKPLQPVKNNANLQSVQVIFGWLANMKSHWAIPNISNEPMNIKFPKVHLRYSAGWGYNKQIEPSEKV